MSPTGGSRLARLAGLRPVRPVLLLATALLGACTLGPRSGELHPPSSSPAAGAEEPAPRLDATVGAVVESEVGAGERHVFPIELEEGTYFEVHVDRPGDELDIHLFDPGVDPQADPGAAYVSGERATGHDGQMLWEVTRAAGEHHLRVDGQEEPAAYRLEVVALRPATERDWSRHRGMRIYEQGQALQSAHRPEDALEKFLEARELFTRGEYERGIGATYSREARLSSRLGQRDRARTAYRSAADHWRRAGDVVSEVTSWNSLANLDREAGDWKSAEQHLDTARARALAEGDATAEARVLYNYCRLYRQQGFMDRSLASCLTAFDIQQALDLDQESVLTLIALSQVRSDRGDLEESRNHLLAALDVLKRHPHPSHEAIIHNDLAVLYQTTGDYLEALIFFQKALDSHEARKATAPAARVLFNMGTTHAHLGELEKTYDLYQAALRRMTQAGEHVARIEILHGLAWVSREMGDLQEARRALDEALDLSRGTSSQPLLAFSLRQAGEIQLEIGRPAEALAPLEESLRIYRTIDYPWQLAPVMRSIAAAHSELGQTEQALEVLHEAVQVEDAIGKRSGVAESYYRIALLERRAGRIHQALESVDEALRLADQVRGRAGTEDLQVLYSATVQPYHDLHIDLLMEEHARAPGEDWAARALRASERRKAHGLREIIVEAALDLGSTVPHHLQEDRAALRAEIERLERRRRLEIGRQEADEAARFEIELDLDNALTRLEAIERRARESNPRYAALTDPEPVSLAEIQQSLLDPETALLEYSLGEERSFLWLVTRDSFQTYELPSRDEIETAARCVHRLIKAYGEPPTPDEMDPDLVSCLGPQLESYRGIDTDRLPVHVRGKRRQEIERSYDRVAAGLAEAVLGEAARSGDLPIRLAVVSDGALEYVPFAALPSPSDPLDAAGGSRLLIDDHQIFRIPSASVLAAHRRQRDGRSSLPSGLVAIVADPVYDPDDPRVSRSATGIAPPSPASVRSEGVPLRRLDSSGEEARQIASLVPAERRLVIEGLEATRERVTQGDLGDYLYVHFATHGQIDTQYPKLSSLVLSRVDAAGRVIDSGHLRLHDIYNLDLDDVDMVVLSACETALGREVRGEGLMGLTRGFLYAGADRVAATLWQVQDVMTAELMTRFYTALFEHDCAPADALRRAQIAVRDADGGAHSFPYYWASFVLQGEWR